MRCEIPGKNSRAYPLFFPLLTSHLSPLIVLRLVVGTRFQVLFHSPPGVLFTFPSRYWSTIGRQGVFSLGRWSSRIPTGFLVPRGTQVPHRTPAALSPTGLSPSAARRSSRLRLERPSPAGSCSCRRADLQPPVRNACRLLHTPGLGSSLFARRYSGNRLLSFSSSGY